MDETYTLGYIEIPEDYWVYSANIEYVCEEN